MPCFKHDAEAIREEPKATARALTKSTEGHRRLRHLVAVVHEGTCDPERVFNATWMAGIAGAYRSLAARWAALLGKHGRIDCPTCVPACADSRSWPCHEHGGRNREAFLTSDLLEAINQTGFEVRTGELT
jgi:hypothetical protein